MHIKTLKAGLLGANCYLIELENECIIIDPSVSANEVTKHTDKKIAAVFLTHAHFDHFWEMDSYLKENIGYMVNFFMAEPAYEKLANPSLNGSVVLGRSFKVHLPKEQVTFIKDGSKTSIDGQLIKVHAFPGHTDCCLAFEIENNLFCGDFVFAGNVVGRTDFPTGNKAEMQKSLERFEVMFLGYNIFPGHDEHFTK